MTWRILPTRVPSDSGPLPIIPTSDAAPLHSVPSGDVRRRDSKITADQSQFNYFYTSLLHRTKPAHTLPSPSTLPTSPSLHRQSTPEPLRQRRIRLRSQRLQLHFTSTHQLHTTTIIRRAEKNSVPHFPSQ